MPTGSTDRRTDPKGPHTARRAALSLLALLLSAAALVYAKAEYILLGAEAYIFGYPLVMMDVTRVHAAHAVGPQNQLHRARQFPNANFRAVVRPNVDTLYTTAFINMDQGPWVFEMAANAQRYEVMPFMDAWTNVFAAPGTRTSGTAGGRFLLAGPHWQGSVPEGMTLLRSPTQMVWLIGRTQTNGAADYALVHRLQDGLSLRRLSDGAAPAQPSPQAQAVAPSPALAPARTPAMAVDTAANTEPPLLQMQAMAVQDFFTRLATLMVNNPPAGADAPMLLKLSRIGVAPGQAPQWGPLDRASVAMGRWLADFKVAQELKKPREWVRGWSTPPAMLGQYGTHYNIRAVVAMVGLGANWPADAMYPQARVDAQGQALNGSHRYRLHFSPAQLPPVRAFWSVTAYGADDFLIANPLNRYALGDRDPLLFNADGSLDLWIQAQAPAGEQQRNWLPVKADAPFLLNARLYWPRESALNGEWGMPAVERLD